MLHIEALMDKRCFISRLRAILISDYDTAELPLTPFNFSLSYSRRQCALGQIPPPFAMAATMLVASAGHFRWFLMVDGMIIRYFWWWRRSFIFHYIWTSMPATLLFPCFYHHSPRQLATAPAANTPLLMLYFYYVLSPLLFVCCYLTEFRLPPCRQWLHVLPSALSITNEL